MVSYVKKKDFKESCIFQKWEELDVGFKGLPELLWKDIKGEEIPGIVTCDLRGGGSSKKNCIRKKCPFYITLKKVERIEEKLDKFKGKVDNKSSKNSGKYIK